MYQKKNTIIIIIQEAMKTNDNLHFSLIYF